MARRLAHVGMPLAALLVTASTLVAYRQVAPGLAGAEVYPWGSDTWGHLFKMIYLLREINQGHLYPDLLPAWYMGLQMLRYHAPLTYYLLAGLYTYLGDIVTAGNVFLLFAAWMGGLSLLLFRRWTGLLPALLAAMLYPWLPDHLRVAFAEGNLPRALASTWLPLALYFLCLLALKPSGGKDGISRLAVLGLATSVALVVLSHAMMGAIFAVCLTIVAVVGALASGAGARRLAAAVAGVVGGLGLSAWWLLPSLTGGIMAINAGALSDAVARFSPSVSLNPALRLGNHEAFYASLALCAVALVSLAQWRRLAPVARALLVSGLLATAVSFEGVYSLFVALPLHQFLWPIRFASFGGPALLLGGLAALPAWRWRTLAILAVLAMSIDFYPSAALARGRTAPVDIMTMAQELRSLPGWRVAVADLSRLGAGPSYFLSEIGGREQVFGWAYQGAQTARAVAALNEAFERGFDDYVRDRLDVLGVDDVLLVPVTGVAPDLGSSLEANGLRLQGSAGPISLYHRDGAPRATLVEGAILGIGGGAYDAAMLFPRIVAGGSVQVDDYSLADLADYSAVYLSGFSWSNQQRAERLIRDYAAAGGTVVVDLTGAPRDPLARVSKFLGVYAEPVVLDSALTLVGEMGTYAFKPFDPGSLPWHAFVPQGVGTVSLTFGYLGSTAIGLGYQQYGLDSGRIWFLGANLPYHAFLTRDRAAIEIMESVLGARAGQPPQRTAVALDDYQANVTGYRFRYTLDRAGLLIVPVAHLPGLTVRIDGQPAPTMALDTLIGLRSPAGQHSAELTIGPTPIYWIGAGISLVVMILMIAFLIPWPWRRRAGRAGRAASVFCLCLAMWLALCPAAQAAAPIVIDGSFGDWSGQMNIGDPQGDATDPEADIAALYWANNANDATMYWMVQRYPPASNQAVTYFIRVDTNNDGAYDQTVTVTYHAKPNGADVTVSHGGRGAGEPWDASGKTGGQRVEVGVPFASLGITIHSTIRFKVESQTSNQIRDGSAEVQYSPVPTLGVPLLVGLTAVAILAVWWFVGRKQWRR